jgi:hypothetical protein
MSSHQPSRRSFTKAILATPFILNAQNSSSHARVRLDPDRLIGAVDPNIYGNFAEHLGRCIEGGIFDEGSSLSDANGYRKDVRIHRADQTIGIEPDAGMRGTVLGIHPYCHRPPR